MALIGKFPGGTLVGNMHKWNCDFGISINEMMVKVGETKEGLKILGFLGFGPILDNLDLVWGHGEALGRQHVSKVFTGSDMELAFVCTGKKSIRVESLEYFPNMGFVLGNVVGIDEDVVQIDDDYDVNHIRKDVVHKLLKSCWCISSPFRHYQPLERTVSGLECSFPFVSRHNPDKMVCVLEVDFGIDSCFSWSRRSEISGSGYRSFLKIWLRSRKSMQSQREPS